MMHYKNKMRKSISAFMIFTLSMVCTMSFCPVMVKAAPAQMSEKDAPLPCHGESSSGEEQTDVPMLSSLVWQKRLLKMKPRSQKHTLFLRAVPKIP
jgi:hypothetical protein